MMLDATGYSVLTQIYDAAVDPSAWPDALDALAESCDAKAAALLIRHPDAHIPDIEILSTALATATRSPWGVFYGVRSGHLHDGDWNRLRHVDPGQPYLDIEFGNSAEFLNSRADYKYLKRKLGVGRRVGMRLSNDVAWFEGTGLGLREGQHDLTIAARRALVSLAPHLSKAVELTRLFLPLKDKHNGVLNALHGVAMGMAVVRQTGEVVLANPEAQRIFDAGKGLRETSKGHLRCHAPRQTARLMAAFVEAALAAGGSGLRPAFEMDVDRAGNALPLLAEVIPLRDSLGELDIGQEAALLVLIDPTHCAYLQTERFAQAYGLSETEAAICAQLVSHDSADTVPDAGTPEAKSLLRATGTQNWPALLRRMARVVPPLL